MKITRNNEPFTPTNIYKDSAGNTYLTVGCEKVVLDAAARGAVINAPLRQDSGFWCVFRSVNPYRKELMTCGPYKNLSEIAGNIHGETAWDARTTRVVCANPDRCAFLWANSREEAVERFKAITA